MRPNNRFLDPEQVLFQTGLSAGDIVVDLGAGSGFFAMGAAKLVGDEGRVFVVDILETALDHVLSEARLKNFRNIETIHHDLETGHVPRVPEGSADLVIMANLVHQIKHLEHLLAESYRLLKTSGKLLVLDWNSQSIAIGPKPAARIAQEHVTELAAKSSLKFDSEITADQFHFGLMFSK